MEQLLELLKAVQLQEGGTPVDLSLHPTIGEVLKKAIAHGSQTEKAKLYNELNGLKGQLSTATTELATLRAQQAQALQNAPAQSNPSTATNTPNTPGTSTDQLLTQVLERLGANNQNSNTGITKEDLAGMLSTTVNQVLPGLLQPLQEKLSTMERANLEEYRQRRLAELGDTVIPELVKGSTREEIEASIAPAREIASRYAPKGGGTQNPPTGTPPAAPTTQAPAVVNPPAAVQNPPANTRLIPDVSQMSDKEYAAQREELMRKLQTAV